MGVNSKILCILQQIGIYDPLISLHYFLLVGQLQIVVSLGIVNLLFELSLVNLYVYKIMHSPIWSFTFTFIHFSLRLV